MFRYPYGVRAVRLSAVAELTAIVSSPAIGGPTRDDTASVSNADTQ